LTSIEICEKNAYSLKEVIMKRILAAGLVISVTLPLIAVASPESNSSAYQGKPFVNGGIGYFFNRVSGDNYLGTGAGWPDDHYMTTQASDQPAVFLGGGYAWVNDNTWLPAYSLGFRVLYATATSISGVIDQYSLPSFRNYSYFYEAAYLNLLGTLKVDLFNYKSFMPYVLLGAGFNYYSASDYTESAYNGVTARVSPGFQSNSGFNFAYNLGGGIDYALTDNVWLNVEYYYGDYGTIQTGNGMNYATLTGSNYDNESLKNKMNGTTAFFGVTYYPA
jgi:opacity protein-like surface antigen